MPDTVPANTVSKTVLPKKKGAFQAVLKEWGVVAIYDLSPMLDIERYMIQGVDGRWRYIAKRKHKVYGVGEPVEAADGLEAWCEFRRRQLREEIDFHEGQIAHLESVIAAMDRNLAAWQASD